MHSKVDSRSDKQRVQRIEALILAHSARRCGAKTRVLGLCKSPAMVNGKCRMHGGKSLKGEEHPNYKCGYFTVERKAQSLIIAEMLRKGVEPEVVVSKMVEFAEDGNVLISIRLLKLLARCY